MNKSEMADKLADKANISRAKAAEIINHIFSTKDEEGIIAAELDAGHKVNITGFGTFSIKRRSEREGRNPATGETITIAARSYAHFSAARGLMEVVAAGYDPGPPPQEENPEPPKEDDTDTPAKNG